MGTVLLLVAVVGSFVRAQAIAISPKKPDEMRVNTSLVYLGDIFHVSPTGSALSQELKRLPLIELKNPGTQQQIQSYQVQNRLSQAGYGNHVQVNGEFPLTVQPEVRKVSGNELTSLVDKYFRSITNPANARSIRWEFIREPAIEIFPGDDFTINFAKRGSIRPGRFALQGTLTNGQYRKSVSFLLNVKITQTVYIATEDIGRGDLLTKENIRTEPRALDVRENQYAVRTLQLTGTSQARRNIRQGEILLSTMVKKQDIVRTGETVRLLLQYGNIRVQSYGKAIESGALAEVIRVREQESGKILRGKVLNEQTIQIEPLQNL